MRLDERAWVVPGGLGPQWRAVSALRVREALDALRRAAALLQGGAPAALAPLRLPDSIAYFLSGPPAARDRIAAHPAFDCWTSLTKSFLERRRPAADVERHFPFFQCFAAALAAACGHRRRFAVRINREARFHASGTPDYFKFPAREAGGLAVASAEGGRLRVRSVGGAEGSPRRLAEAAPGVWVEHLDPLVLQPVVVHGLLRASPREEEAFVRVMSGALEAMRRTDGLLFAEMTDLLRVLVPLKNPAGFGSVSSSYMNLRGAVCLSHSEDSLLQQETLVHEFCHQKMNLLLATDSLLEPGQSGKVFYSPWRPDPRRLQGLLLGAHAFLNVSRYLLRALSSDRLPQDRQVSLMLNVSRRLFQIEAALRSLSGYAATTAFGSRFVALMWRELMLLRHAAQGFPEKVVEAARRQSEEHRRRFALSETGLHRPKGFDPGPPPLRVDERVLRPPRSP